jgi:transitional endoplasmic reticulum ATPase
MLRPGRLDAVIDVTPPDGPAIERLIKVYAAGSLEPHIDLAEIGEVLAGNIPAVIAEVVKRAKLSQLSLQARGTRVTHLTAAALLDAAKTIQAQVLLLNPAKAQPSTRLDDALADVVRQAFNGAKEQIEQTAQKVREIHDHVT